MGKLDKIKVMLQNILVSFNQVSTSKGVLNWDGQENLPKAGDNVWLIDSEGTRIPTEDTDYVLEDGTVIQIQNGVVVAIVLPSAEPVEPEAPETPEEEPIVEPEEPKSEEEPEEQPQEEEPTEEIPEPEQEPTSEESPESEPTDEPDETEELRNRISELEAENERLRERIKELESEPAAKSATEEFKEVTKITKTGNRQLDNLARIMNAK